MATPNRSCDGSDLSVIHGERDLSADDVWLEVGRLLERLCPRIQPNYDDGLDDSGVLFSLLHTCRVRHGREALR